MGASNGIITHNDPRDFSGLKGFFDLILVDAPCSGSGLFRKDPDSVREWSRENVELCSLRQQRIVADIWPCLREGGVLIYATCSYSAAENETVIGKLMEQDDAATLRLRLNPGWGITETVSLQKNGYGYRFYPYRSRGEGFFLACIKKTSGIPFRYPFRNKEKPATVTRKVSMATAPFLRSDQGNVLIEHNGLVYSLMEQHAVAFYLLKDHLYFRKAGVLVGKMAGDSLLPEHELALSKILREDFPSLPLDLEQSLHYLRKEDMDMELSGKGWAIVEYRGHPLGWVKMLERRINNYYPKTWRILH